MLLKLRTGAGRLIFMQSVVADLLSLPRVTVFCCSHSRVRYAEEIKSMRRKIKLSKSISHHCDGFVATVHASALLWRISTVFHFFTAYW